MIIAAAVLAVLGASATVPTHDPALERILDAIRAVETGGTPDRGRDSTGDGGRAIGPFQIHWAYWKDAGLPGAYEDCREAEYSRDVVLAYFRRFCPKALEERDAEVLARTHNGGPTGAQKASTIRYWKKVERELQRTPNGVSRWQDCTRSCTPFA